jgi:hypothetical protein
MTSLYSAAAIPFLFRNTPDRRQPAWCKVSPYRRPHNDIVYQAVPLPFTSILRVLKGVNDSSEPVTGYLFLDFHLFPAAMQFSVTATGHDKFRTAHRANISFSNLICHILIISFFNPRISQITRIALITLRAMRNLSGLIPRSLLR